MPSVTLDLNQLSAQVYDLAVLSQSNDVNRINVDELINLGDHLVEALAHIRSLQNLFSPINRLPPEILANIISFLQYDLPSHSVFPLPQNLNHWAEVLSICRHWRRHLIDVPSLWRQIHVYRTPVANSVERARAWFGRSQGVPFKFYYTGVLPGGLKDDGEETEFPVDVFSHVSRLQELHICSSWVRDSSFWRLVDQPAPNLESFSFIMEKDDKLEDHLTVLPRIFQDDMPRLKSLALGNVSAWPHNRFANLTRLLLENQPPHARPSLPELLAFLAASPKLQELALVCAGPTPYDYADVDRPSPVITLPFLQYLEIGIADQWRTKGKHLQLLLKHLDVPITATRCFYEPKSYLSIAEHFMQREDGKWVFDDLKKIVMTSHDTEPNYRCFIGLKDSTLYCNCAWETPSLGLPSDTMLLQGVEELVYAPAHCWEPQNFTALLGQLPSLRRLKISGLLWAGLDEVLKILQEMDSVGRRGLRYVPQLQELYIYPPEMEKDPQSEEGANFVMMLGNVRANNGCPLKKIVVHQFLDQSVQQLQEYFDGVVALGEGERTGISKDDVIGSYWRSYDHFKKRW